MAGEIKTKFVLEGEQKFKSAMKESANNVKLLNAQQKLAAAQFKNTGDAEKYQAEQTKLLEEKITEQKKAVEAAEAAVKKLKDSHQEGSAQMQQWQMKLVNAQTALTNTQNELKNLGASSDDATVQTDNLAESVASIDKKANIKAVVDGIGTITSSLEAAAKKAIELGKEFVNAMKDAASWSDDLATDAMIFDMDVETLQRMRHTADLIDTDVESIIKSQKKLQRNLAKPSQDVTDAFLLLKVDNIDDQTQQLRDWQDIFWETGEALMNMTDDVNRESAAFTLFGKSWSDLMPLFKAGRKTYEETMNAQNVVSEENIKKLNLLDDSFQNLENNFETLKMTAFAALAPALQTLSDKLTELFTQLNKYLQSEEGQQKMQELSDAFSSLVEDIGNIDFSAALETAKGAIDSIKEGLKWLKDNKDKIVTAIEGIGAVFLGLKLSSGGLQILNLINGLKGLNTKKIANELGGILNGTGTGTPSAPSAPTGVNGSGGTKLRADAKGISAFAAFIGVLGKNAFTPQGNADIVNPDGTINYENLSAGWRGDDMLRLANNQLTPSEAAAANKYKLGLTQEQVQAAQDFWDFYKGFGEDLGDSAFDEAWEKFESAFSGDSESFDKLNDMFDNFYDFQKELGEFPEDLPAQWFTELTSAEQALADAPGLIADGINAGIPSITSAINNLTASMTASLPRFGLQGFGVTVQPQTVTLNIDGAQVGQAVTPYVSQNIAEGHD